MSHTRRHTAQVAANQESQGAIRRRVRIAALNELRVLWLILNLRNGTVSWRRFVFGLALFVPWLLLVVQPIGPHVAGFLIINALYVALIVVLSCVCAQEINNINEIVETKTFI